MDSLLFDKESIREKSISFLPIKISVAEKWAVGHCYHISLHITLLIHLCQHCLTGIRQNPLKLALLTARVRFNLCCGYFVECNRM